MQEHSRSWRAVRPESTWPPVVAQRGLRAFSFPAQAARADGHRKDNMVGWYGWATDSLKLETMREEPDK